MRKPLIWGLLALAAGITLFVLIAPEAEWSGVDESVVNKFAKEAGRPPREPYINTGKGDILLFCFLVAGAIGGFIAGYQYRSLFPPREKSVSDSSHV
jgi:ABC-type cobalt transport system substrate-binding protein